MKKLIIIGGGNMGFAIADGITQSNLFKKPEILIIEKNKELTLELKHLGFPVSRTLNPSENILKSSVQALIIAVKPADIKELINSFKRIPFIKSIPIISIAAGIQTKKISFYLKTKQPVIRVMPNTPCQIKAGISAIAYNKYTTKKQKQIAKKIFSSLGEIIEMDEKYFDSITAISGSGPAYFCYFIECLIKSAISLGIKKDSAYKLVIETGEGTLKLLRKKKLTPEKLRQKVTSPKGTTEAAIKTFEKLNLNKIILKGLKAAKERGVYLGKTYI